MNELITEIVIAVVLTALTVALLRRRRRLRPRHKGFDLLLLGLVLVSCGAIADAVNAERFFPGLAWWTGVEAFLELYVGFVLGIVLVAVGLWLWLPALERHQREMAARLEAEQRLREQERRYREVVDSMPGFYFMYDRAGRLLDWNLPGRQLVDRSEDEMAGLNLGSLVRPEHRGRILEAFARALGEGQASVEAEFLRQDGTTLPILAVGRSVRIGDEERVVGLAIDISERRRAEDEVARHAAFRRLLLDISTRMINIPTGEIDAAIEATLGEISRFAGVAGGHVFLRSVGGDTVSLAHAWHDDRLAYSRGELQGLRLADAPWTARQLMAARRPVVVRHLDELPEEAALERDLNRSAGVEAYVSVPLLYRDEVIGILGFDSVEGPRDWSETELSLLQVVGQIITNALQRKWAEERLQQLNLELEDRVRSRTHELETVNRELESFAYSVSHDLRAPLRAIVGFSQALLKDQRERLDATGRDYLDRVAAAGRRLGEMIDGLLTLSRATRAELRSEVVDLGQLAAAVVDDLRAAAPERRVEVRIADGLEVTGDPRLLGLVVQNLLDNAWKFSAGREPAHVEVGAAEAASPRRRGRVRAYFVRDDGAGFDMRYADKLFEPFQRLHGASDFSGTGIGLATVKRIVHRHGGRVWAEAGEGEGATLYFTLGEAD